MIKTICYGKEEEWATREEAIKFYIECADASDGAERERYTTILLGLLNGEDIVSDGDDEY